MDNNEKRDETIVTKRKAEQDKLIECFRQIPIIEVACRKSNVVRGTYYRWMEDDSDFRDRAGAALTEGEDFISDKSEAQIVALVGEKHFSAAKYWLSHHRSKYQKEGGRNEPERKIRIILIPDDTKK